MSSRLRRGRKNTMHNTEMIVGDITVEIMRKANLKNLLVSEYYPTWKEAKRVLNSMPLDYMDAENKE